MTSGGGGLMDPPPWDPGQQVRPTPTHQHALGAQVCSRAHTYIDSVPGGGGGGEGGGGGDSDCTNSATFPGAHHGATEVPVRLMEDLWINTPGNASVRR